MKSDDLLFGCIEGGGTKFIVALTKGNREVIDTARIPTTDAQETIGSAITWMTKAAEKRRAISAIGIASFGPADLDRHSATWGHVTTTPKPGWRGADLAGPFARAFGVPVGFDTDVNGAALAEARWGAGQGQAVSIYITIGTGIGGGAIVDGRPLRGLSHPEMGHFMPRRHPDDMAFAGMCPVHGDCAEGLASGPAIIARWGRPLSELPEDHPGHEIIAWYIAQLVVALQAMMEPGRIIIGGGVSATPGLLGRIARQADRIGAGYFRGRAHDLLVPPGLGDQSGLMGALALAQDALVSA